MISPEKKSGRRSLNLAAIIRQGMGAGKFPSDHFLPSVRQLGSTYGLAGETVRRALKELEGEGLLRSVPRQGYRVVGPANGSDRSLPVAYLAYEPNGGKFLWDDFHQTLLTRFQDVAASHGWALLTTRWSERRHVDAIDQLRSARVAGAILDKQDVELLGLLRAAGIAPVIVDAWYENASADLVAQDGFAGGALAAAHLAGSGHRRIGMLGPEPIERELQIVERYGGVAGGLRRFGLDLTADMIVHAPLNDAATARAKARDLLSRPDRPAAILALWQDMVQALVDAAADLSLVPGRDFDMIGWSTEEEYASRYTRLFSHGPVPPAVVWSMDRMADMAMRCIRLRRMNPDISPILVRVPVRLKLEE